MLLGVTPNSVQSLTLPKEGNTIETARDICFAEIAIREKQNRPLNEDRIRGFD